MLVHDMSTWRALHGIYKTSKEPKKPDSRGQNGQDRCIRDASDAAVIVESTFSLHEWTPGTLENGSYKSREVERFISLLAQWVTD
jgi:hypothetical protein